MSSHGSILAKSLKKAPATKFSPITHIDFFPVSLIIYANSCKNATNQEFYALGTGHRYRQPRTLKFSKPKVFMYMYYPAKMSTSTRECLQFAMLSETIVDSVLTAVGLTQEIEKLCGKKRKGQSPP